MSDATSNGNIELMLSRCEVHGLPDAAHLIVDLWKQLTAAKGLLVECRSTKRRRQGNEQPSNIRRMEC